MHTITAFDCKHRYILLQIKVADKSKKVRDCIALLDTGAPASEFSDRTLEYLGFLKKTNQEIELHPELQTQKYGKVVLPYMDVCSHPIENIEIYVSHFDKSWGIDALIGLDFFRKFRVTVDYDKGQIVTEPLKSL